jgi:hypothetical protein
MTEQDMRIFDLVDRKIDHYNRKIDRDIKVHEMVRTWALYTATGTLAACYIWALLNYFVQTFGFTLFLYGTYWAGKFIVEVVIKKTFMGGENE